MYQKIQITAWIPVSFDIHHIAYYKYLYIVGVDLLKMLIPFIMLGLNLKWNNQMLDAKKNSPTNYICFSIL